MAVVPPTNVSTLQFVVDALSTMSSPTVLDLTQERDRRRISTNNDFLRGGREGHLAIRNPDGTGMTIAQIAAATNLTVAQVTDIAGRV